MVVMRMEMATIDDAPGTPAAHSAPVVASDTKSPPEKPGGGRRPDRER